MIAVITPLTYQDKRRHRRLANRLAAEAGVEIRDVTLMERIRDRWHIETLLRDADDQAFLITERVICKRTVTLPPYQWEKAP